MGFGQVKPALDSARGHML